ncbi:MAG: hypothetical protein H6R13_204 [Proteobacteria bacterium]|nr:hypothetical protein [Pseudomonadota bacterium]
MSTSTWTLAPLKRFAEVMPSNVDKHSVDEEQVVRLCNYVDVYRNERVTNELDFMVATASDAQIARFTLCADDVIVTKDSEEPTDIGIPAYVPEALPGVVCGYHLALLRPFAEKIHGAFLHWALQSAEVHDYYSTAATGISRYALSINDLGMTPLRVPCLSEQIRIANFLDGKTVRIDALIAEKEKLQSTLEEWRSAEFARICFGGVSATESTGNAWIPVLPAGWRCARLKHLIAGIEQGWSPECEARLTDDDEWGVLKAGAANGGIYRETEHKALPASLAPLPELEVKPGDVLVTRASGSADLVGSFAYVYQTRPHLMLSDKNFRLKFAGADTALAKFFVETTKEARKLDPCIELDELASKLSLSEEDVEDAVFELKGLVTKHQLELIYPEEELFVRFDKFWMGWDPAEDALRVASGLVNDENFPCEPSEIDAIVGWGPRRLNAAIAFLVGRSLIKDVRAMDGGPWLAVHLMKTDATRRFVKSR